MTDNVTYPTMLENNDETLQVPAWAKFAKTVLARETDAVTVTSKVVDTRYKFGNTCSKCPCKGNPRYLAILRGDIPEPPGITLSPVSRIKRGFPKRCPECQSTARRWTHAAKVFVRMDEIRINEGFDHLRFVTLTRANWNLLVPMNDLSKKNQFREELKQKSIRSFRNWRHRNKWWQSRNALGQYWPECTESPVWNGVEFVGIKLHFHVHCIFVSKYLDNRPNMNQWKHYQGDSTFYKEWGGIVDVRSVKDYKNKYQVKGETRYGCGRKACMRYLSKYISKAKGWQSGKIGKW